MSDLQPSAQAVEELFDQGIERYRQGESPESLIPVFKDICDRAKKNSSAWTCLAWLYLLANKPELAFSAAQKAVKINPQDPQARINLALAMLDGKKKGVREHVEIAQQIITFASDLAEEVEQNLAEGLQRKPDWKSLQRIQTWLAEG
jgi:predicted Zn-dependent protease